MAFEVEQLANNVSTTLNGGINSSVTSVVITSATGFPATGIFRVIVGTEIMKVTARSGTTLTVARGSEGSTPASHSNGDAITIIQTAAAVQALLVDAVGHPLYTYPRAADFTWTNQGGAAVDENGRGLYLNAPASGANALRIQKQTAPGTPYTLTVRLVPTIPSVAVVLGGGIGFRESATGKLTTLSFVTSTGPEAYLAAERWDSASAYNASMNFISQPYRAFISTPWLRLRHDGTLLYYEWSNDGYTFSTLRSEAKNAFFTTDADELFFYANANHATLSCGVRVLSWAF